MSPEAPAQPPRTSPAQPGGIFTHIDQLERDSSNARWSRRKKNGWTREAHLAAEAARPGATNCECCGSTSPRTKAGWQADHDHRTGKFRGYLCQPCNLVIGHVETHGLDMSPTVAVYLARHHGTSEA